MTIEITDSVRVHQGNGVTTEFGTPFIRRESDLQVSFRSAAGGVIDLVLGSDYDVAEGSLGAPGGGTVTVTNPLLVPNVELGTSLVIVSVPPFAQPASVPSTGMPPKALEGAIDDGALRDQYLLGRLDRSLSAPDDDLAGPMQMPREFARASRIHSYDSLGRPLMLSTASLAGLLIATGLFGTPESPVTPSAVDILFREDLDLRGDGTDDSPQLQRMIDEWSAKGGALFFLQPDTEAGSSRFHFKNRVRMRSGVSISFVGQDIHCGKNGGIRIQGELAELPVTNKPRLLADITAGATTAFIDMGPDGGGTVSSRFPVGSYIVIRGETDGAGSSVERGEHRVTAVDNGLRQITVSPAFEFGYKVSYVNPAYEAYSGGIPDRTYISAQVRAMLTADVAAGGTVIPCDASQVGALAIGDHVALATDHQTSSGNLDEVEIARVVDIGGDGANAVTLNRRTERAYTVANGARLTKIVPAVGCVLSGASIVYTEAPDASPAQRRHAIEVAYGANCVVTGCGAPNTDLYGFRGQTVRFHYSYNCRAVDCYGGNPKHTGSGDGYIFSAYYSTQCEFINCTGDGGRHNFLYQGATLCNDRGCTGLNALVSDHDWHGLGEVGCWSYDPTIIGGTKAVGTTRTAATFGNTTHFSGSHRCGIKGGSIRGYLGTGAAAMRMQPPSTECGLFGVSIDDVETLLYHADLSGSAALVAERGYIVDCKVSGVAGKLFDVHGGRNGSATRTLKDLTVEIEVEQCRDHGSFRQVDGLEIALDTRRITTDAAAPYALTLVNVIGLDARLRAKGARRGVSLTDSVGTIARSDFRSLTDSVVLLNGGGNTIAWRYNDCAGFTPTVSGGLTGITAYPLPVDQSADFRITS